MGEELNYSAMLPRTPPEDLVPFLQSQGQLQEHTLIYRHEYAVNPATGKRVRAVLITCSACGMSTTAERVSLGRDECRYRVTFGFSHPDTGETIYSGTDTVCPSCGAKVRAEHVSLLNRGYNLNGVFCMTVGRIADRLTLTQWYAVKSVTNEGQENIKVYAYEAAVVEETRLVRLTGCFQVMSGTTWYDRWEQRKNFLNKVDSAGIVYPWDPSLLTGSTAENSALDRYLTDCGKEAYPAAYLRLWQKRKNVENLVVQGAARLVNEMIKSDAELARYRSTYPGGRSYSPIPKLKMIQWKERRPAQMLGLNKDEFRECVRMEWNQFDLYLFLCAKKGGVKLSLPQDMEDCVAAGTIWCAREWEDHGEKRSFLRSARYLRRQRARHPDGKVRLDGGYLGDYWRMAEADGLDLTDEHLLYPRDIIAAHDKMVEKEEERRKQRERARRREQAKAAAKEAEQQRQKFAELAERLAPLSWEYKGILIRCAATPEELEEEGSALSHCVGGYKNIHAKGEKPIFFIRRAKEPDKSWYTLQLDLKKRAVIQNRGKVNCEETEEVIEFREKWVEHIQGIKLPEKRKCAKVAAA